MAQPVLPATRRRLLKQLFWRRMSALSALPIFLGIQDLAYNFAPTWMQDELRLSAILPRANPLLWVSIGLAVLLGIGFEGAFRLIRGVTRAQAADQAQRQGEALSARNAASSERAVRSVVQFVLFLDNLADGARMNAEAVGSISAPEAVQLERERLRQFAADLRERAMASGLDEQTVATYLNPLLPFGLEPALDTAEELRAAWMRRSNHLQGAKLPILQRSCT